MLQLEKHDAFFAAVTLVNEKHGEENVKATSLRLRLRGPNTLLDAIKPGLRQFLYRPAAPGEQIDLYQGVEDLVALRDPRLKQLKFDDEFPGYTLTLHTGLGLSSELVFRDVTLRRFAVAAIEGGSCEITFSALVHPTRIEMGNLGALLQESNEITLAPPTGAEAGTQQDLAA
ncbi:hypothetical protein [Coralloluteibacterium thermophilus]|uniref:DUF1833 domain-containing protein n=1 Tax=Coralloluteibacterium thermophilum TaxID=2707049 RepID=A0ABV9NGR8_9GAMM